MEGPVQDVVHDWWLSNMPLHLWCKGQAHRLLNSHQHLFYAGPHHQAVLGGWEGHGVDAQPGVGTHYPGWGAHYSWWAVNSTSIYHSTLYYLTSATMIDLPAKILILCALCSQDVSSRSDHCPGALQTGTHCYSGERRWQDCGPQLSNWAKAIWG